MSRRLQAIAPVTISGRKIDWMLATLNHEGNARTYTRRDNAEDGPTGQYWSFLDEDNFDKSVWVIEGDEPVVPSNIFTDPKVGSGSSASGSGGDSPSASEARLVATMATRDGTRIDGWDLYEDFIILGETPVSYIIAATFDKFKWDQWGVTDEDLISLGTGLNNATPKQGNTILSFRVTNINQPDSSTKWTNVVAEEEEFDIESESLFTAREEYVARLERAEGKKFFRLSKKIVRDAIQVPTAQPTLGFTESRDATKIVEFTWQAESVVSQTNIILKPTPGGGGYVSTGIGNAKFAQRKGGDIFATSGYVRYDEKNDICIIDAEAYLNKYAPITAIGGPSTRYRRRDYHGMKFTIMDRQEMKVYSVGGSGATPLNKNNLPMLSGDVANVRVEASDNASLGGFQQPLSAGMSVVGTPTAEQQRIWNQYLNRGGAIQQGTRVFIDNDFFRISPVEVDFRFRIIDFEVVFRDMIAVGH